MTSPVPKASDKGKLRRGFFTSPAVKVMLFQASDEKSEPTCPTQTAINIPNAPPVAETVATKDRSDLIGETFTGPQKLVKLMLSASALRPIMSPRRIKAKSARVFAEVKTF